MAIAAGRTSRFRTPRLGAGHRAEGALEGGLKALGLLEVPGPRLRLAQNVGLGGSTKPPNDQTTKSPVRGKRKSPYPYQTSQREAEITLRPWFGLPRELPRFRRATNPNHQSKLRTEKKLATDRVDGPTKVCLNFL